MWHLRKTAPVVRATMGRPVLEAMLRVEALHRCRARPRHIQGTSVNFMYKGSAPIFVTTKLSDLQWLEANVAVNPDTGAPWDANAAMVCTRLKVYRFTKRMAKPPTHFQFCPRCFVNLLHGQVGTRSE